MSIGGIGNRIKGALREMGKRQADMASDMQVSPQRISHWIKEQHDPPLDMLGEIATYLGKSVNWLLGEPEGFMEVGGVKYPVANVGVRLPSIGSASAGDWSDPIDSDDFEYIDPEYVVKRGQFVCKINGDSMFDMLWPGDLGIWCKYDNGGDVNHVVVARDGDNRLTIKQLVRRSDGLFLRALNEKYKEQELKSDPIGYLLGFKRLMPDGETFTRFNPRGLKP